MQFIPPAATSTQFDYACIPNGQHPPACYLGRIPAWDNINDTLPDKIRLCDVDGMVEIGGRFVFIEHKWARGRYDDGEVPEGQRRALCALSRLPGVLSIILMTPTPADAEVVDIFARFYMDGQPSRMSGSYSDRFEPYDRRDVIALIHAHLRLEAVVA